MGKVKLRIIRRSELARSIYSRNSHEGSAETSVFDKKITVPTTKKDKNKAQMNAIFTTVEANLFCCQGERKVGVDLNYNHPF